MPRSSAKPPTHPSSSSATLSATPTPTPTPTSATSTPTSTPTSTSRTSPAPDLRPNYGAIPIRSSSSQPDLHTIVDQAHPGASPTAGAYASNSARLPTSPSYATLTPSFSTSSLRAARQGAGGGNNVKSSSPLSSRPSLSTSSLLLLQQQQQAGGNDHNNNNNDNNSTNITTNNRHNNPNSIAASTSFFGFPLSLSMLNVRASSPATNQRGNVNTGTTTGGSLSGDHINIDYSSLYVIYIVTLVAESARGLLLPSTWPYFRSLGGFKSSLGFFVASFSLGRMFSTIPLGYLSDSYSISLVLTLASLIQVVGHLLYAIAPSLFVLFGARVAVGLGSATMSVCRAHLTRAVPVRQRTVHFAYLSGLQFIGFAVLPGVGGLMTFLPKFQLQVNSNSVYNMNFNFDGFTYPAYVLAIANLLCVFLIQRYYENPPPIQPRMPSIRSASLQRLSALAAERPGGNNLTRGPDIFALVTCLLLNIVYRGVIAEFETISVPFVMERYAVSFDIASYYLSGLGVLGLIIYMAFKPISLRFSDRTLVVVGLLFILCGCMPLALPFLSPYIPPMLYIACLGLTWSVAYPVGQTATLAVFSKILYGLPAGGLLGIFSASGSVARIFMAVLASQIWKIAGREAVFATIVAYTLIALALAIGTYGKLKPRSSPMLHLLSSLQQQQQQHDENNVNNTTSSGRTRMGGTRRNQ